MKYIVDYNQLISLVQAGHNAGIAEEIKEIPAFQRAIEVRYEEWRDKWEPKDAGGDEIIHVDERRNYYVYITPAGILQINSRHNEDFLVPIKPLVKKIEKWMAFKLDPQRPLLFNSKEEFEDMIHNKEGYTLVKLEGSY